MEVDQQVDIAGIVGIATTHRPKNTNTDHPPLAGKGEQFLTVRFNDRMHTRKSGDHRRISFETVLTQASPRPFAATVNHLSAPEVDLFHGHPLTVGGREYAGHATDGIGLDPHDDRATRHHRPNEPSAWPSPQEVANVGWHCGSTSRGEGGLWHLGHFSSKPLLGPSGPVSCGGAARLRRYALGRTFTTLFPTLNSRVPFTTLLTRLRLYLQISDRMHAGSLSYSTVTLFAKFLGLSTSVPRAQAVWYASSCSGTTCRMGLSAP